MDEHELRDLIAQVKARRLARPQFIDSLVMVGPWEIKRVSRVEPPT